MKSTLYFRLSLYFFNEQRNLEKNGSKESLLKISPDFLCETMKLKKKTGWYLESTIRQYNRNIHSSLMFQLLPRPYQYERPRQNNNVIRYPADFWYISLDHHCDIKKLGMLSHTRGGQTPGAFKNPLKWDIQTSYKRHKIPG